ncbi:MAG: 4-hydroxy-tetrahydrodipicolinate synthase [Lacibacter sp.]
MHALQDRLRGTGVAIVTPFLADGTIDWDSFQKIINHIIEGKCEYIVVLGTTGETATISASEKQQIFSFVRDVNKGRVALVAGIGGNNTHEVLQSFKTFDLEGYEAILSVAPYYNKPNQEGMYRHYKLLNEHTPLPLMIYNVPGRTGQNLTANTQLRIARDCKNVFATKEASGNFEQIMEIIQNKPEGFLVISGDDALTLPMIACGAHGVISVVANVYPAGFSEMVRKCLEGDFVAARSIHYKYMDVIQALFAEGSPSGVKAFLSELGLCANTFRMPVWPVSEEHLQKIKQLAKDLS